MKNLYVVTPDKPSSFLEEMIQASISSLDNEYTVCYINNENDICDLRNTRIIFAIQLNEAGFNINLSRFLTRICMNGRDALSGSVAGLIIHGHGELYTKTTAQTIIFHANQLGCRFPGRPLVEATESLCNFLTLQKAVKRSLKDVCLTACRVLGESIAEDNPKQIKNPNILALHASSRKTSNTLNLWDMINQHLKDARIKEIHIENGTIRDCKGCPYTTCKHYGKQTSCFYGGIMVEEIYPAILESDAVIFICPNYNDALSANMTAVINRLTALFRKTKFYDKNVFGIIVSGNSGGDALGKQLISALNINKTFRLPPYFSITATANDKGAIFRVPNIEEKAREFAVNILKEIKA